MLHRHSLVGSALTAWILLLAASAGCGDSPTAPSTENPQFPGVQVDSVTPAVGSTVVATQVTIHGTGFRQGATVAIGNVVRPTTVLSDRVLTVSIPAQPPAVHDLVVANPDGGTGRLVAGFRFEADLPTDPVSIRIVGTIFAGDTNTPVSGATVRLMGDQTEPLTPVLSDENGRFIINGTVSRSAVLVLVQVTLNPVGLWVVEILRKDEESAVLRLPDLLAIRAGGVINGELLGSITCTFEDVPCRLLVVSGAPGSLIDLELIPENGQKVGLILDETFLAPTEFPKRLTVSPRALWVMGAPGKFTVKAVAAVPSRDQ